MSQVIKKINVGYQFLILAVVLMAGYSCSSARLYDHTNDKTIAEVRSLFAPDSRVAVFSVQAKRKGNDIYLYGETSVREAKKALIDNYAKRKYNIIDNIRILPDGLLPDTFGVVRVSVSNIRSQAFHSAELTTQATTGTPVRVLSQKDGWYMVQTPDSYIGWVDRDGIQLMDANELKEWNARPKIISNVPHGLILKADDVRSAPVSDFVSGSIFALIGDSVNKDFWIVSLPDKRIGYVEKKLVLKLEEFIDKTKFISASEIINTAFRFIGTPYLWGGTSSKGMDCSGFTKTVFFLNGMIIQRDASQQLNSGDAVHLDKTFSSLKPGDLLFFGTLRNDGSERISHVAIYIGSGRFIHAAGDVKIESLLEGAPDYNEYRASTLMHARRYLGSENKTGIINLMDAPMYFN